ncbi:unnamed protein product [Closterium sp. Naga37s-1]|nr:unnamed protein product [Closterium sp. Naga37s-1]
MSDGETMSEAAGGMEARVEQLAAKLAQQEEAMAALKSEVDELRRAVAQAADAKGAEAKVLEAKGANATGAEAEGAEAMRTEATGAAKGAAAKGALETGSHGETAKGKEAGDDLPAEPCYQKDFIPVLENLITGGFVKIIRSELASTAEGLKQQAETVRSEAAGAAGALKAEIARMKAAAERQAAEVAYVRATAAHAEARVNELELAVAEWKSTRENERAEQGRAGRSQAGGSAGAQAGAETPEGKRRKLDEAGKAEEMAHAAAGGCALVATRGASDGKQDGAEWKAGLSGLRTRVEGLQDRVGTLESRSADRGVLWEALLTLWAKAAPQQTEVTLRGISTLTNGALTRLTSLRQLITVDLGDSSGFSAVGVRKLYSLPSLMHLDLTGSCTDAALEGIDRVKSLRTLILFNSTVTDVGLARLEGMTSLLKLQLGGCRGITSAGARHLLTSSHFPTTHYNLPRYLDVRTVTIATAITGAMSHGVPVTVRPEEVAGGTVSETAGGMVAQVEHLAAKLRQQEEAMAALKKEVDELRRAMAKVADANGAEAKVAEPKGAEAQAAEPTGANAEGADAKVAAATGAAAKGALERGRNGGKANGKGGAGSAAAGDDAAKAGHGDLPAEILDGKEIIAIVENFITEHVVGLRGELESQAEGFKQQVDAVRSEAADAAGALKAEIAQVRAAAERQAAEVAYVRAIAAHAEERTNDLELAVAEGKSAREKARAEERGCAETPEGKRRKLDEAGKAEGVASAAAGGRALVANRGAPDGKRDEGEIKAALSALQKAVDGLLRRVDKVEDGNHDRGRLWEALLTLWAKAAPQQTEMEFIVNHLAVTSPSLPAVASLHPPPSPLPPSPPSLPLPPPRRLSLPSRRRLWWVAARPRVVFLGTVVSEGERGSVRECVCTGASTQAHSALAPNGLAPNALAPSALAPNAQAPRALAPNALAPSALALAALAPSALAHSALVPSALAPNAQAPRVLAPNALAPNALALARWRLMRRRLERWRQTR